MSCQRVLTHALDGDAVQTMHHLHLDPLPRLVGDARRFVDSHAPELPAETHDALLLLTSELVTNAVLHARTPIELGITVTEHAVLVTVHDLDLARPAQRPYDGREGGWGLGLVAALADASDLETHDGDGKTAWFRVSRGAPAEVLDDAAARPQRTTGTQPSDGSAA
ncbi:MAG: regulatory protein [Frankiales bacterium]|nr:regulatory protein [Frankiales bacterium]